MSTEDRAHIIKPITLADTIGSPKAEKKSQLNVSKPKEQGTWVRYTRVTKASGKVPEAHSPEVRREALHTTDPRHHKRQNVSHDDVLISTPRWTP